MGVLLGHHAIQQSNAKAEQLRWLAQSSSAANAVAASCVRGASPRAARRARRRARVRGRHNDQWHIPRRRELLGQLCRRRCRRDRGRVAGLVVVVAGRAQPRPLRRRRARGSDTGVASRVRDASPRVALRAQRSRGPGLDQRHLHRRSRRRDHQGQAAGLERVRPRLLRRPRRREA